MDVGELCLKIESDITQYALDLVRRYNLPPSLSRMIIKNVNSQFQDVLISKMVNDLSQKAMTEAHTGTVDDLKADPVAKNLFKQD